MLEPEDESSYGRDAIFRLAWQSEYTLKPGECFLLTVGYVQNGSEVELDMCMQDRQWWVNDGLYLQADQETGRAYQWWVTVVREETGDDGNVSYIPMGPSSEKWTFYWR